MRNLPFLNGVRAFEAAARHNSFKAAAVELNVTPAAISRMVKLLEERLGVQLFERKPNGLALTAAGHNYQSGLSPLLDAIADLTTRIQAQAGARILTVGVGPTFATRWLIPRLAAFQKAEPDIELRFATGGAVAPFTDDWTCGIVQGEGAFPGRMAEPLVAADLLPVCAPALADSLRRPTDLKSHMLLRVTHAPGDWTSWLNAAGLERLQAKGPEFELYAQALQAATDGLGVAMGIRPYIDDDLAAGRLVAPFSVKVSNGKQWYLVYRAERGDEPAFNAFRRWIIDQASLANAAP